MEPPLAKALLVNVNGLATASVGASVEVGAIVEAGLGDDGSGMRSGGGSVTLAPHAKRNKQLTNMII